MEPKEIQNLEEDTIDLLHMTVCILKKWRILLVATLIGGLLGGAWQLLPKAQPQTMVNAELTEEMRIAAIYHRQYAQQKAYVENSSLMKMDSNHVFRGELEYYVSECHEPELVASHFESVLKDASVRLALCEALQLTDETDLDYLVGCGRDSARDAQPITEVEVNLQKEYAKFGFSVQASSEEQAENALVVLEAAIDQIHSTLKLPFELVKVFRSVHSGNSETLRNIQKSTVKEMDDSFISCVEMERKFTEKEKVVYERYLLNGEAAALVQEQTAPETSTFSIKKAVITAVVGALVACVWFAVKYLLNTMVKTADDVAIITRRNVIGLIREEESQKRGIDGFLDRLEAKSLSNGISVAYAAAAVKKLGDVVLICDKENAELNKVALDIGGGAIALDLVSRNADSLNRINQGMQIVLLAKLGETSKDQLRRETALYGQYGLTLAGTILVK